MPTQTLTVPDEGDDLVGPSQILDGESNGAVLP
jgi:hypothetical protein